MGDYMKVFSDGPKEHPAAPPPEVYNGFDTGAYGAQWDNNGLFFNPSTRYWEPARGRLYESEKELSAYQKQIDEQRTQAQRQLSSGIGQARSDIMSGAGARGFSPALGRSAGWAGAEVQQRGVGQAEALRARERAGAEAMSQQLQEAVQAQAMQMGDQYLSQKAAEYNTLAALAALESQKNMSEAAAEAARERQLISASMSAGSAALSAALSGATADDEGTFSDKNLKKGISRPLTEAEAQLFEALRSEGSKTEAALEEVTGKKVSSRDVADARANELARRLREVGAETESRLGSISAPEMRRLGAPVAVAPVPMTGLQAAIRDAAGQPVDWEVVQVSPPPTLQVAPTSPWAVQTLSPVAPGRAVEAEMARLQGEQAARQLQPTAVPVTGLGAMSPADMYYMGMGYTPAPPASRQIRPGSLSQSGLGAMSSQERKMLEDQALGALSGAGRQYEYNAKARSLGQPGGVQYGPMAQDLAKSKLGRSAVIPTPSGLAVDTDRLSLINAGLTGQQEERLRKIEEELEAERRKTEARLSR